MASLADMLWSEWRKAYRSGMLWWTGLGSLLLPLGIGFLIFVAKNPEVSQKLGLISAKANLTALTATDWPSYLALFGQVVALGGLVLFVLVMSWVFGREFADGTLKDVLAVPVPRASIVLAKFVLVAAWSAALALLMLAAGLALGALVQLPQGSADAILQGGVLVVVCAALSITTGMPFALAASVGRGYLLPMGALFACVMLTNIAVIAGWGEYFPWAVPGLLAQGKSALAPISYAIVALTGLVGVGATYVWWKFADQNR